MSVRLSVFSGVLCAGALAASACAQGASSPQAAAAAASVPPAPASAQLRPALDGVQSALAGVSADRWKLPKELRAATDEDIASIRRDLEGSLPSLLATADGTPGAVSAELPVASNVGALYDVLLRVTERAKIAAPAPVPDQLVHALAALEAARRSFAEHITQDAAAQERRVVQLQTALNARPAVPATPAVAPKPCPAPPKSKHKAKTASTHQSTAAKPE